MEAITRIAQIAKPMTVFTVFLLQDAHSEASSNYGAMGRGAIEGFLFADTAMGLESESRNLCRNAVRWRLLRCVLAPDDTNSM